MNRKALFSFLSRILILSVLVLTSCITQVTPTVPTATQPPTQAPTGTYTPVPPTSTNTPVPVDTVTPSVTPQPPQPVVDAQNFELVCIRNEQLDPDEPLETTPFFVKGQVILTGPANRMDEVVNELAQNGIVLTPVYRCTMGVAAGLPDVSPGNDKFSKESRRGGRKAAFPFSSNGRPDVPGGQGLAMNLYQFDDQAVSLSTIFDQLNALQRNEQKQGKIYADANYLTGHLSNSACGNPFGVEGSPFGVEGSPFGVEGSPNGGMSKDADPAGFWNQWAFERIQLLGEPGARNFEETGRGVRVGVFDTSPYRPKDDEIKLLETELPVTEDRITPQLDLTVHFPMPLPKLVMTAPPTTIYNVKDHGLFVSSLIHAMAYNSTIELYEVLDEQGCGDLFRLDIAILHFLAAQWRGDWLAGRSVINLSLGVRKPSDLPANTESNAQAGDELDGLSQEIRDAYDLTKLDGSVESMETVLQWANAARIVIVAAAGNNSVLNDPPVRAPRLLNMPLHSDLPADYNFVVGVSATNPENGPSCYSNFGDVAAPGGDAKEGVEPTTSVPICVSLAAECPDMDAASPGACEYGVMGMSTQTDTRFAYWSGTSFATPLASGLAALLYERYDEPIDIKDRIVNRVNGFIGPNRRYGTGVIQVLEALAP